MTIAQNTILLVDDDTDLLSLLSIRLAGAGYHRGARKHQVGALHFGDAFAQRGFGAFQRGHSLAGEGGVVGKEAVAAEFREDAFNGFDECHILTIKIITRQLMSYILRQNGHEKSLLRIIISWTQLENKNE